MRTKTKVVSLAATTLLATPLLGGELDPNLSAQLDQAGDQDIISTLVYMSHRVDVLALNDQLNAENAGLKDRHFEVLRSLQDQAAVTQIALLEDLQAARITGEVEDFHAYWIANAIRVDATPDMIESIAARKDVDIVYFNYPIEHIEPVHMGPVEGQQGGMLAGGPEPGVGAVRAPEVWAMGFDGSGVLVSIIDTGTDGNHPALASRWRGLDAAYSGNPEWAFYDPFTGNHDFPFDGGSHGTHVMGSVLGGAPGDQVGVAPGAQWISAASIDRGGGIPQTVADAILSFEWMVDPDGNPGTIFDVPATCSNSWGVTTGHGYPPCDETFWSFLDACEAAGIVIVFAAGNEGGSGLRRPSDRATNDNVTLAVAAVDGNTPTYPIASFSSRGPTFCTPGGGAAIKPDIAAPGVNVRSSVPGGGYSNFSGTSMATPHINGVIALMRQANPDLSVDQIKQILYSTATDLGAPGEDNDYGNGIADAVEAVTAALETVSLVFTYPLGRPDVVDPALGANIVVHVGGNETQNPATAMIHYNLADGAGDQSAAMTETAAGEYLATIPTFSPDTCGDMISYYFSIETIGGDEVTNPFAAPDATYAAQAFTALVTDFEDDFEGNMGWTVSNSGGLTDGAWERAVPAGGGDRGDPAADADGSGNCYVTDNADDNSDVDDGTTTLTSPTMDASDPDIAIAYSRWYSNCEGADPGNDNFVVEVSDNNGASWVNLETVGPDGPGTCGGWNDVEFLVSDIPGISNSSQFRIRFHASDLITGSVVEAGVDGVQLRKLVCGGETKCVGDLDGSGSVGTGDLLQMLAAWGPCPGCDEDIVVNGQVDTADLLALLAAWGECP